MTRIRVSGDNILGRLDHRLFTVSTISGYQEHFYCYVGIDLKELTKYQNILRPVLYDLLPQILSDLIGSKNQERQLFDSLKR